MQPSFAAVQRAFSLVRVNSGFTKQQGLLLQDGIIISTMFRTKLTAYAYNSFQHRIACMASTMLLSVYYVVCNC